MANPILRFFDAIFKIWEDKLDADRLDGFYKRAITAAGQYLLLKTEPPNNALAFAVINEILTENVLQDADAVAFRKQNEALVRQEAQKIMKNDYSFREAMTKILWTKRSLDETYLRPNLVADIENGWAFKAYSADFPMATPREFEALVMGFEGKVKWDRERKSPTPGEKPKDKDVFPPQS